MVSRRRVVDHIVDELAARGVGYVFGVDGANIEDLYDALFFRDGITGGAGQARVLGGRHGRRYWPGVVESRRGGGDLGRRRAESRCGAGGVVRQPGSGAGARRPGADRAGRARQLPGHQRAGRIARRRGGVLGGVGVLPAGRRPRRHRHGAARGHRRRPLRRARGAAAAKGRAAEHDRRADRSGRSHPVAGAAGSRTSARSSTHCAARAVRSPSSPASRWPATTRAPSSRSCAAVLRAWVATVPDAKDVSGSPGWARRRRWASPA